ncbi:hypothetical protein Bca101_054783 [Brassica carinata]
MGGCVACYRATETLKDPPPFNSLAQKKKHPSGVSEDFWSTSTVDMDSITFPSQGGSLSSSNQTFDSQSGARNSNAPSEFVNQGLLLWNQTRERWVGKERASNPPERKQGAKINWNAASYDNLLGSNKMFPQPIPLNEMVDFLVEFYPELPGAAPKTPKVEFIAPTGERIKSRRQLGKYLRAHPGSPHISEFDWTNGEAPRRSPRILQKVKARTAPTPDEEIPIPMKKRRSSLAKEDSAEKEEEAREAVAVAEENVENAEPVVKENEEGEKAEAEKDEEQAEIAEAEKENEGEKTEAENKEGEVVADKKEPMEVDTSEVETGGTAEESPKVAEEKGEEKPAEEETENKGNATSGEPNLADKGIETKEADEEKADGEPKLDADAEADKANGAEEAEEKKAEGAAAVMEEKINDVAGEDTSESMEFDVLV